MMKLIKKLVLRRDTIKTLTAADLTAVNGGAEPCTAASRLASTCAALQVEATEPPHTK